MKALKVTKSKVVVEMTFDDLYTIFHSLNGVVELYDLLDLKILEHHKEVIDDVLEELTNMLASMTDNNGNAIPS